MTMVKLTKKKGEIIRKSNELAIEYEAKYKGCGQCTFLAIIDALRWGGLEIIPKDMEDRLFPGVCLLTGGVGLSGEGTCGAVAGGVLAIGLALGFERDNINESLNTEKANLMNTDLEKMCPHPHMSPYSDQKEPFLRMVCPRPSQFSPPHLNQKYQYVDCNGDSEIRSCFPQFQIFAF